MLSSLLCPPADQGSCPVTAGSFQTFFTDKVAGVRQSTQGADPPVLSSKCQSTMCSFQSLSVDDMVRLLRSSNSKSCELDTVPTWLIKEFDTLFAPILTRLVNSSLASGVLPVAHKRAVVRPILKKPGLDPSSPASYRPVSNVTFLSKLIERVVDQQLKAYLNMYSLLPVCQSGFRKFHSTETAVVKVYNDVVMAADAGRLTILVMLDYSAAFDTVDHEILLDVLRLSLGLGDTALKWIGSYLSDRTQMIRTGDSCSDVFALSFGVPQGGILGPLLYIIYTADIIVIFEKHGFIVHLYADDSQIYLHFVLRDIHAVLGAAECCVQEVTDWSSSRRLKLQGAKTEIIIFDRAQQRDKGLSCTIRIDGVEISTVSCVRDLGVHLDSRLDLKSHISRVSRACYYHIRRLHQIRGSIDESAAKTVAVSLVLSRLDYCNALLAGLPESTLQPLTRVLHSAARVVLRLGRRDHITPALRSLHWLPIRQRIKFKLCLMMHNIVNNRCPVYLSDMVTQCAALQRDRRLRSASSLTFVTRRTRLRFGERAFCVAGPNAWNSLPTELRFVPGARAFKNGLKTLLFGSIL